MGTSTGRDVHIDQPLSNVAIAYRPQGMIADQVAPIVPVQKQSDGYYIWNIADMYRSENDKRAPGTEANVITREMSSGTYFAKNYALKDRLPWEDIENADAGYLFTERSARAEFIKEKLMLNWEVRLASQVTSTSNVGSSSAVGSSWTDHTNADPINDLNTAIYNVQDATGYRPNRIVFGLAAWRHFRENAAVISRMFGNQTAANGRIINTEMVKSIFELEQVLVGGGYQNTAQEGQTASLSKIWGDHVLVYYAPLTPRKDRPSFMYSFRWEKIMNMQATVLPDAKTKSDEIEVGYYQDEKITATNLGFLVTNVTSST